MKPSILLREFVKRKVKQTLAPGHADRDNLMVKRSLFLKQMIESDGKSLLNFITITNDPYELIKSKKIMDHIKQKSNLTFNRQQLSVIKLYIEKLGALFIKKKEANYYSRVELKD